MSALRAEIYSGRYRNTRSPFPDATDVYILGALVGNAIVDPEGPSNAPLDAANAVLLIPRGQLGPIFVPAVYNHVVGAWLPHPDQFAMGGRYVGTSDSRFARLIRKATGNDFYGAVPLHDYSMTSEWHDSGRFRDNAVRAAHETVAEVLR